MTESLIRAKRRQVRKQFQPRLAMLGDSSNRLKVTGRDGYIWVRDLGDEDANGNTSVSDVAYPVRAGSANYLLRAGRIVWIGEDYDGQLCVKDYYFDDVVASGADPTLLTAGNPVNQFIRLYQVQNFNSYPISTNNTPSTKVSVRPLLYVNPYGTLTRYNGTTASTHPDLSSYYPAVGYHRWAVLGLRMNPGTLNPIQVSTSTARTLFSGTLTDSELNEATFNLDPDTLPIRAYRLANTTGTVTAVTGDAVDEDLRQFINVPPSIGRFSALTVTPQAKTGVVTVWNANGTLYSRNDTTGVIGTLYPTNPINSFTVAGDSGTPQTITNGDTLTLDGTNDIVTAATATDTVTISGAGLLAIAPTVSTRNVAQPTSATVIPLILRGAASQSADLQQWQNSSAGVLARVDSAGSMGIGATPSSNNSSLAISKTVTATGVHRGYYAAVAANHSVSPSVGSSIRTLDCFAFVTNGNSTDLTNLTLYGGIFAATHIGTNTLGQMIGAAYTATLSSSGNVTTAVGQDLLINNNGTGTISSGIALRVSTMLNSGGGAITTGYGILINNISVATTNYSLVTNAGLVVFNEGGNANSDVRAEGDTDANLFFTDASEDKVGIGTNAPGAKLQINTVGAAVIGEIIKGAGSQTADLLQTQDSSANVLTRLDANGGAVFNENGSASGDVRIEGDTDTNLLFTDASTDFVGIGTNAPTAKLDINSNVLRLRTAKTPSSASDTGNAGDICWDSDYIYVCVATNTWKRSTLASW